MTQNLSPLTLFLRFSVGILLSPILFFGLLAVAAWLIPNRKRSRLLWLIAFGWLVLTATPFLPSVLIASLENQYPTFSIPDRIGLSSSDSIYIMALAAGYSPDPRLNTAVGQLAPTSLARLAEAIRIHRQLPHSKIVCSAGPARGDRQSQAAVTARAAVELGVAPENLLLVPTPANTREEAIAYRELYGAKHPRLILVTSACHLPRAMLHFQKAGLDPIPAPADFKIKKNPYHQRRDYWPSASNMVLLEMALHEYVGMWWGKREWKRQNANSQ